MFVLEHFLQGLDGLYADRRAKEAEDYLKQGLKSAAKSGNDAAILVILNELMGYYRAAGRYEECLLCTEEAVSLAKKMGLEGSLNYGTTLLNAATAYRAAGKFEKALDYYEKTKEIYEKTLKGEDYRMAALHNNISLLYSETGRMGLAKQELESAMKIMKTLGSPDVEIAITHTNLGYLCFQMKQDEEGRAHMEKAVQLFEKNPDSKDSHYASTLAGLAESRFREGCYKDAVSFYKKALGEIEECYGENEYYRITKKNLQTAEDLLNRTERMEKGGIKGLALSKMYYETYGKPLLEEKYAKYKSRIAAGLIGQGSECMGFDDLQSVDHDYGAGFCLWLSKEDFEEIGKQLQKDYDSLPKECLGFPARNTQKTGERRIGVFQREDFFKQLTGFSSAPKLGKNGDKLCQKDKEAWRWMQPEVLSCVMSGEIFDDPSGTFSKEREAFSFYPEEIFLEKLSVSLGRMAQAGQYNYERMRRRKDIGGMYFCLAQFLDAAVDTAYLLNRMYTPIYKWKMKGMKNFHTLKEIKEKLERIQSLPCDMEGMETRIEEICGMISGEMRRQKLSTSFDNFLETHKRQVEERALVLDIVKEEWEQFQNVQNEGGRASCQDDWETFEIMRKSQFYTWRQDGLKSYYKDLVRAKKQGWNLLTEKYARMMESTAPEEYEKWKDILPKRSEKRRELEEEIIRTEISWAERFSMKYPHLGGSGRSIHTAEDTPWDTSMETYLRGELGTYSDETLLRYKDMIAGYEREGKNLTEMKLTFMTFFYGYRSLDQAEQAMGAQETRDRQ